MVRVKTLDRYVFSEALRLFLLSLLTFLTLFLIVDMVSNLSIFMKHGLSGGVSYLLARIPLYLVRVIPIATLLCAMLTLSSLSASSELIAAKALGISVYRLSLPIFLLSLFISLFSLSIQEFLLPKGMEKVKLFEKKDSKGYPLAGLWLKNGYGDFIFFWSFDASKRRGERITVLKLEGSSPIKRIDAREAVNTDGSIWELRDGFIRNFKTSSFKHFNSVLVELGITPRELLASHKSPQSLGLWELFLTIQKLSSVGYETRALRLELFSRIALSLLPVVVALIGVSLGVYNPRNKKGYTAIIAALIIVSMWITISLFLSMGKSGILPPSYASFAPLFIFGAVGLILLARVET